MLTSNHGLLCFNLIYEIIEFLFLMSLLIVSFVSFLAEVHKRTRGKTLMNRVHTRPFDKRIPLNMNKKLQPISDDDKVISEIGYFLGTLKRCVPLTYKSWRDVPENLKTTLLNYVKVTCRMKLIVYFSFLNNNIVHTVGNT